MAQSSIYFLVVMNSVNLPALASQLVPFLNRSSYWSLIQTPSPSTSTRPSFSTPDILNLSRDPAWQSIGVIVGAVLALLGLWLAWKQLQKKELTYQVLSNENIVQVADTSVGNELQIFYKNVPINNLYLIIVEITNSGNTAIRANDFSGSLYIRFHEHASVLGSSILNKKPQNLRLQVALFDDENALEIHPLLLNRKDSFTLQFFVTDYNGITLDGRIENVEEIKEVEFAKFYVMQSAYERFYLQRLSFHVNKPACFAMASVYIAIGIVFAITGHSTIAIASTVGGFYFILLAFSSK